MLLIMWSFSTSHWIQDSDPSVVSSVMKQWNTHQISHGKLSALHLRHDVSSASFTRHSMAKVIYARLFDWLVWRINESDWTSQVLCIQGWQLLIQIFVGALLHVGSTSQLQLRRWMIYIFIQSLQGRFELPIPQILTTSVWGILKVSQTNDPGASTIVSNPCFRSSLKSNAYRPKASAIRISRKTSARLVCWTSTVSKSLNGLLVCTHTHTHFLIRRL